MLNSVIKWSMRAVTLARPSPSCIASLTTAFSQTSLTRTITTSAPRTGLMEFFDDQSNWKDYKVKHGRAWRLDELRLKSNADLHKLWYVLHKERNMVLTMEELYTANCISMPSPERIAKVDESMQNLLTVVDERNVAYNLLETGKTGKNVPYRRYNSFGFIQYYREKEYYLPWFMNKMWKLKYHYKQIPSWSKYFTAMHRSNLRKERNKKVRQVNYAVRQVLSDHPDQSANKDFIRSHFQRVYGYKQAKPYHEMIRRPAPNELPAPTNVEFPKSHEEF